MTGICFCRSDFSIGESMLKVTQIAKIAKEKNYSAVALCDTMTLSSLIEASQACAKENIPLISGVRLRIVEDATVKDKKQNNRAWFPKLYFKNEEGLRIAYKLLTMSFADDNFYYVPRLSFEHLLNEITTDVIISLGDQHSQVGTRLLDERVQMLVNKIGAENIVAECIPFNTPIFDRLTKESLCIAEKYGLKLMYSDLCMYSEPKNKKALIALSAIASKGESVTFNTPWLNKPVYDTAYIKDYTDYIQMCKDQMNRIKSRYNIDVTPLVEAVKFSAFGFEKLFSYKWEAKLPCLPQMDEKPFDKLKKLCKEGFKNKLTKPILGYMPDPTELPKYAARLQYELDIIEKLDFSNYFLLVKDILDWARQNGMGGSYGRGCLAPEVLIKTDNGYKPIKEVKTGDYIYNRFGQKDLVVKQWQYKCDEKLLSIKGWRNTPFDVQVTNNHKILAVKNPFKTLKHLKNNSIKGFTKLEVSDYLNINKAEWIEAKDLEVGDYVLRPINYEKTPPSITRIDLSKYCSEDDVFDDEYIYETRLTNKEHPLCVKTVAKKTGLCASVVNNYKHGVKLRNEENSNRILDYLQNNGYTLDDFINFEFKSQVKINRYIDIDKNFMFFIGYYIGDGCYFRASDNIGLAFNHGRKKHCLRFFKKYFSQYNLYEAESKNKKDLIQLIIRSGVLKRFIQDTIPGYSEEKKIPDFVLQQDIEKLKYLLLGLKCSDGHYETKTRIFSYDSNSVDLIFQVRDLVEKLGYQSSVQKRIYKNKQWKNSYKLKYIASREKKSIAFSNNPYLFCKIREIKEVENPSGYVYDLMVKNNPSYMTSDYIVHNSSGGCLIAFLLDIVETDPIRFGLMFERFINPSRHDLPDVDMDISSSKRQELIAHIIQDYGSENVASISNYITLGASGVIRACGRVYGLPINEYNCSSKVPSEHGVSYSLSQAVAVVPEIELFATKYPEVWETALQLEGCISAYGVHAAGLIVAGEPLINRAAVENRRGNQVVCWDKLVVESMGLIKMDLLGLTTLDVLNLAKQYVKDNFNVDLDLLSIPLDDKETLKLFGEGKTSGVFQFEVAGALLKRLAVNEPLRFEDLVAATALNRPGPMDSGLLEDYVAIKQGLKDEHYDHPNLKEALKETYGVIVYQEQVMKASMDLAGFTASEADFLRKAMGKKDKDKMASMKQQWIEGCQKISNMHPFDAEALWNKIEAFAGYGFNRSHAVEYTLLSFASMYIKAHYPTAFYAATLSVLPEEKLKNIVKDADSNGIKVLPPDINLAGENFTIIDDKTIMIPFNRVKGVGPTAVKAILDARADGLFTSYQDFETRVTGKCNKRHRESLNKIGAFANIVPGQQPSSDITRLKDQYELLPELVIKTLKSTKRISGTDVKKALDKNNEMGQSLMEPLGKKYVHPYSGKVIRYVVIFDGPNKSDLSSGKFANVRQFEAISTALNVAGITKEEGYWTGLMKTPKEQKEITTPELALNLPLLQRELQLLKPEIIVLMGPDVIRQFAKDVKKPSEAIGQSFYDAEYDATFIIGMNPGMIYFRPEKQKDLNSVFEKVATMIH